MTITSDLRLHIIPSVELSAEQRQEIIGLCNRAYEEDLTSLFDAFSGTHILGFLDEVLVTHAMWVTRWLQVDNEPLLRTAYVELVATEVMSRSRGFASAVMRRLATEVDEFDIAALSPSSVAYYARLGWQAWQGSLHVRKGAELLPTPDDEEVMILLLPNTPDIDLSDALSVEWREGEVW